MAMTVRRSQTGSVSAVLLFAGLLINSGCFKVAPSPGGNGASSGLSGQISIEGSSTVFPISQAISREFESLHPGVQVPVAGNGTSSGFKKFLNREVEICDASRRITEGEIAKCAENQIEYLELQVAIDGLSVVVNKDNDWVDTITVAELNKIWDEGSTMKKWNEVRPEWPDQPLELYGAGTDSGTFDYFTEVINGKAKRSRSDYHANENDNVLVNGIATNKHAMGYFGFAYYVTAADKLRALKIAAEEGAAGVAPTPQTVEDGTYKPLSRPLFIYVNQEALKRPEVAAFVAYYLSDVGQDLVEKRKYVRLNPTALAEMQKRLADAVGVK